MIYGMARECVVWFWFEFYHLWIFLYDDDNLRVLFHGDVFFLWGRSDDNCDIRWKRLFSRWVGVCRCFRKTGDIHNMAETIFLRYIFTFSLLYVVFDSVPHNDLLFDLCFLFVCVCSLLYKNMHSLYALFRVCLLESVFLLTELCREKITINYFNILQFF